MTPAQRARLREILEWPIREGEARYDSWRDAQCASIAAVFAEGAKDTQTFFVDGRTVRVEFRSVEPDEEPVWIAGIVGVGELTFAGISAEHALATAVVAALDYGATATKIEAAFREGLQSGKDLCIRGSYVPANDPWSYAQCNPAAALDAAASTGERKTDGS